MSLFNPSYNQINFAERRIIERLYAQGFNASKIARHVFRSRSTISREIQRNGYPGQNGEWQYEAHIAHRFYTRRQERVGCLRSQYKFPVLKGQGKNNYFRNKPLVPPLSEWKYVSRLWIRERFRKYKLSRWHEWSVWGWREHYNAGRVNRCYSWEEMGRRYFKPRSDYAFSPYKRAFSPRSQHISPLYFRKNTGGGKSGYNPYYWWQKYLAKRKTIALPGLWESPPLPGILQLNRLPDVIRKSSANVSFTSSLPSYRKPVGRTMSGHQKINRFSKNPALF